jgi:hypothetical protein
MEGGALGVQQAVLSLVCLNMNEKKNVAVITLDTHVSAKLVGDAKGNR